MVHLIFELNAKEECNVFSTQQSYPLCISNLVIGFLTALFKQINYCLNKAKIAWKTHRN